MVLVEISSEEQFRTFPNSIHKLHKCLKIGDNFITYVACPKCNKLYRKNDVVKLRDSRKSVIKKCNHIEFPNMVGSQKVTMYNSALVAQNKPILIYPISSIKSQLKSMYMRPNF